VRRAALRLIALIVLFSGAADYCAFDVSDPVAPMSASGTPGFTSEGISCHMSPPGISHTDTQDDRCLCCAAGFPARPVRLRGAVVVATTNPLFMLHLSDPQLVRVDPPPRA
jgi:hypothetical protein